MTRRAGVADAQDETVGRSDGHPWGDSVAASGEFRWPPTGRFPWPPSQGNLLVEKKDLVKPGHAFSYSYLCEDAHCGGHVQKIVDWELGEAYRSWPGRGQALVDAIKKRWLDEMCSDKREPFFFVGDQHTRPGQFLVLGTFYPEFALEPAQLALDFAYA